MVSAVEVDLAPGSQAATLLDAYRQWMGIPPATKPGAEPPSVQADGDVVEVVVLSLTKKAARCRLLPGGEKVSLRTARVWDVVPGKIATVKVVKRWTYSGQAYLSGPIKAKRLDVKALGLTPLRLDDRGVWDPAEQYWGEPGEPIDAYALPIIARGSRPEFEMEPIIPGEDPEDPISDPIIEANDRKDARDLPGPFDLLMRLCQQDLRCLDAHSHLGNLVFDGRPQKAIRDFEVGVRIGELSLGEDFDGVLPWGHIDNRPFLRCLNGFGLCLWRLDRFEECAKVLDRILSLKPSDNQGVRGLIEHVRAGRRWEKCKQ